MTDGVAALHVLGLTGDAAPDLRGWALARGVRDFVTKPVDATELRARVTNALQVSHLQRQLADRFAGRVPGATFDAIRRHLAAERRPDSGLTSQVAEELKGLKGVSSIAYTSGDPVALAKALSKYVDDNPEFSFKSGILEGRVISSKEIKALATMPSKEEIYSKLLFLLNAPAQRLVTALNAVGRDLAVVVSQGVEKQKFSNDARE